jgi:hypothetical protein
MMKQTNKQAEGKANSREGGRGRRTAESVRRVGDSRVHGFCFILKVVNG